VAVQIKEHSFFRENLVEQIPVAVLDSLVLSSWESQNLTQRQQQWQYLN